MSEKYLEIVNHYTNCFEKHGETHLGVDWPKANDLDKRFKIISEIFNYQNDNLELDLIDLGCGFGLFLDYLNNNKINKKINYLGIDLSQKMIESAKKRFPQEKFLLQDIIKNPLKKESCDFLIMNGLLTEKRNLSYNEMKTFAEEIIKNSFEASRIGIAFNVMSPYVDWERDDLFHYKFEDLIPFLIKYCSRNFIIRNDYGLYEYMIYLFKKPN